MTFTPSVGRIVHYVSYGTPKGEYTSQCRAAIVSEVDSEDPNHVGLVVLNPSGMFFHSLGEGGCMHHDGAGSPGDPNCDANHENIPFRYCSCGWTEPEYKGGTWHEPERV